jgi:membrane-associated phospholipid phosphatase
VTIFFFFPMSKRAFILIAIWIIAMIIALFLDYPIAHWVHTSGFAKHVEGKGWAQIIKEPGEFGFTLAAAALLLLFRQIKLKQAAFVALAGIASGANAIVKWIAGRYRPYKFPMSPGLHPFSFRPFFHGLTGLFHEHDLCFPSGHECTAAALATAMVFVWRRGSWVFVLLAIFVGIERPAENAHYLSDVIGAVGFAVLTTTFLHRAFWNWLHPVRIQVQA